MSDAKVYVVQDQGRYSYAGAERFGELVPLIQRDVFPDDADERVVTIRNIMKTKLRNFNPGRDYLLLTGDPVAIAMAVLVLSCQTLLIPCLKFDRENREYYPVALSV